MGSGKTVQVNRFLEPPPRPARTLMDLVRAERVRRREDLRRVLVISSRVQFSIMAASTFYGGFSLYLNPENLHDDYLVCQYESLHKLMAQEVEPYDLIIIDEYESVLDCMVCFATNGGNMLLNAQVFQAFVRRAGTRVIALDADLSQPRSPPSLRGRTPRGRGTTPTSA
jgi:Mrp family chromosome partitioning ATPase